MATLSAPGRPPAEDRAEDQLQRAQEAVRRARGVDLRQYRRSYLLRRLAVRQRARSIDDLSDYADLLGSDLAEVDQLLRVLTINVTEFFRNPELFDLLEAGVLPDLMRTASAECRRLRAWSAGCASGDEIYSLGILMARAGLGRGGAALYGTDIDPEAIGAARQGVFESGRLRQIDPDTRDTFFTPEDGGRLWRLRTERIPPTRFRVHDLLNPPLHRGLDLALCRNVLIYFETELQEQILARIAATLRPGGVLVLGRVERLAERVRDSFEIVNLRERVYRRKITGASHAS